MPILTIEISETQLQQIRDHFSSKIDDLDDLGMPDAYSLVLETWLGVSELTAEKLNKKLELGDVKSNVVSVLYPS